MAVVDTTDLISHDVHIFQRNKVQIGVVFVAVELFDVKYKALSVMILNLLIDRIGWEETTNLLRRLSVSNVAR